MKRLLYYFPILLLLIQCTPGENGVPEQMETPDPYAYEGFAAIDSLLISDIELPEIINLENFDSATVTMFQTIADGTGGELYYADNASLVVGTIIDIINNHGQDNADICFLIDKTGSMEDDIYTITRSMDTIFSVIEKYANVNVALAFYGDKNVDGPRWYESHDFTTEYEQIKRKWKKYTVSGGGDAPESVTDGAHNAIADLSWSSNSKRIMLMLGDAPSLEPPLASYTIKDIVYQANDNSIISNYYPVVVGFSWDSSGPRQEPLIAGLYPNPVVDYTNIVLRNNDEHLLELFSSEGALIESHTINNNKYQLNTVGLKKGVYLLRVSTIKGSMMDAIRFVKQ